MAIPRRHILNRIRKQSPVTLRSWNSDYPEVYDFYKDIAPEIRKRQLGVKVLPDDEQKAFNDVLKVPVAYTSNHMLNIAGMMVPGKNMFSKYNPLRYIAPLPDKKHVLLVKRQGQPLATQLVHELRHYLARGIGVDDADKLEDVYGFNKSPIGVGPLYKLLLGEEEMATTNKQHQFTEYLKLRNMLGRKPTAQEYFDAISKMPENELRSSRRVVHNGYEEKANKNLKEVQRKVERKVPTIYRHKGGSGIPSWGRFVPDTVKTMMQVKPKMEKVVFPHDELYRNEGTSID